MIEKRYAKLDDRDERVMPGTCLRKSKTTSEFYEDATEMQLYRAGDMWTDGMIGVSAIFVEVEYPGHHCTGLCNDQPHFSLLHYYCVLFDSLWLNVY